MAEMFKVTARFTRSGSPLTGPGLRVKFYDKDALKDDLLGECGLDAAGRAEVVCATASFKGFDSPGETKPDIYCCVFDGEKQIFRSPVRGNVDLQARDPVTKQQSLTVDLGVFDV